jgi:hypothetical protein
VEFLNSIFDLSSLPSHDSRYKDMAGDLFQHRENNNDWDEDWVFSDPRINLLRCADEKYLQFICEIFHPRTRGMRISSRASEDKKEHWRRIPEIIAEINKAISPYYKIVEKDKLGEGFIYTFIDSEKVSSKVAATAVEKIDAIYIREMYNRAYKDVKEGNLDTALTHARTMVEEVLIYILEQNGKVVPKDGDIRKRYNEVKEIYSMHQTAEMDKRINALLGGLEKIITAVTEMRNSVSDSHGAGSERIIIKDYHAALLVNSAMAFADFILSVHRNGVKSDKNKYKSNPECK